MTPVATIARRVRQTRLRQDLTAEDLAQKLQGVGLTWQRSTVAKLENGHRETITVDELLALARVLDVAPVNLLVPLEDETPYQVTPDGGSAVQPSGRVRDWLRGEYPLPETYLRTYFGEVPEHEIIHVSRPGSEQFRDSGGHITRSTERRTLYVERSGEGDDAGR
jgi:transcriptional regulator with XRE-family HTH domain